MDALHQWKRSEVTHLNKISAISPGGKNGSIRASGNDRRVRFGNDDSSSDSDNHYGKNIFMSKRALERKNKGKVDLNASKLIQESDVYNEILKKGHEMNEK